MCVCFTLYYRKESIAQIISRMRFHFMITKTASSWKSLTHSFDWKILMWEHLTVDLWSNGDFLECEIFLSISLPMSPEIKWRQVHWTVSNTVQCACLQINFLSVQWHSRPPSSIPNTAPIISKDSAHWFPLICLLTKSVQAALLWL